MNIPEWYIRYMTGMIHEYSRIYSMNILELFLFYYCRIFMNYSYSWKQGNLGPFTEKPFRKPLERNVVYTAIITLSHATSDDA